ncbi:O-antigen ligase [Ideonella sp. A 288]|uniref:O-antigen ligase family protein n=1 Tax=Ideonella sp. A 288 TaxID=1962181 RepID=UPI000B4AB9D9|nr:O-antigen ligase family protein [Ideonella sp. A 288]
MKWLLLLGLAFVGVLTGVAAALFGGPTALVLFAPVLPMLFIVRDYRVGVACLIVLLPWSASPLLPQTSGFNVNNYLIAATLVAFVFQTMMRRRELVKPPTYFVALYLVPITFGILIAWPYLAQGARNVGLVDAPFYEPFSFLKSRYLKPLGFVIFAWLLANAVKTSKKPERWLALMVAGAVLPSIAVFVLIGVYGLTLSNLQAQRSFMGPLGYHANEMGLMLMSAAGPMLFIVGGIRNVLVRALCAVSLAVVATAVVLSFSRGAFLALLVVVLLYLLRTRRVAVMLVAVVLAVIGLIVAPEAVRERVTTGMQSGAVAQAAERLDDPLTAGRVAVWQLLLPEVAKSPLWGRGLGSTSWSDAVGSGIYVANHPHNLYLEILLDLGLLGLMAILYVYYRHLRGFWQLSHHAEVSPLMQRFFAGAGASFAGVLVMGMTNGHFMPFPEQTFVWFSLGLLFAHLHLVPRAQAAGAGQPRRRGFGMRPAPLDRATGRRPT